MRLVRSLVCVIAVSCLAVHAERARAAVDLTGIVVTLNGVDSFDGSGGDAFIDFGPFNAAIGPGVEFVGIEYSNFLAVPHTIDVDIDGINHTVTLSWTGPIFTGADDDPADVVLDFGFPFPAPYAFTSVTEDSLESITAQAPLFTAGQLRFNIDFVSANVVQGNDNFASAVYSFTVAVPEPVSAGLLIVALGGMVVLRRRVR